VDAEELERLAADLESDRVERKPSLAQGKQIRQAICAFANDLPNHGLPGVVFVGLEADGRCSALQIDDKMLVALSNIRGEGQILPIPAITVERATVAGCDVDVLTVQPIAAPPCRFRGRVYVRVGSSTHIASGEDERMLSERRRGRDLPFDLRPAPGAVREDLDDDLFSRVYLPAAVAPEVLVENRRSLDQQLTSLRFLTREASPRPTVLGVLVVGRDPRRSLPGAYIQLVRVAGASLSDPISNEKEVDGPLPEVLRQLDELLEVNISVAIDVAGDPGETEHPDYPLVALQQLTRNAVLHRNYEGTNAPVRIYWFDDRIEILSPGGPYGQVTKQNFSNPGLTDYRNPHLAEALRNLGYVQSFGVGLPQARTALERNGNPPLEFQVEDSHVLAVVRRGP
jgi:ATP-dependent DNA helicase RecG